MDERPVEGGFDRYRGQYGSEAEANETVVVAAAMAAAMATLTLTWKASSTGGGKKRGAPAAAEVAGGFLEVGWVRIAMAGLGGCMAWNEVCGKVGW